MSFCTRYARWVPALAVLLVAAPAAAGDVAEVRIGQHPTFTRVVFELEQRAGYRVTHRTASDGTPLVRVTLDAGTYSRRIDSRSRLVESVNMDSMGVSTDATIRLRESGLIAKEMILPNPPRIVLDFMREEALLASMAPPAPAPVVVAEPEPTRIPNAIAEAPAPPVVIRTEPPAPVEEMAAAEIAPVVVHEPVVEPEPEIESAPALLITRTEPEPTPVTEVPDSEWAESDLAIEETELADEIDEYVAAVDGEEPEVEEAPPSDMAAIEPPPPTLADSRLPPAHEDTEASDSEGSLVNVTVVAGALSALALVVLVIFSLRGYSRAKDVDLSVIPDGEAGEEGRMPAEGFAAEEQPVPESIPAWKPEPAMDTDSEPPDSAEEADVESEASPFDTSADSLFAEEPVDHPEGTADAVSDAGFGEPEEKEDDMETQVTTSPVTMEPPAAAPMDSGVEQLVRDLATRVAQLESRLDQSVEARENLERQVASQAEELRVQRAAIARTQRALRSMNRPNEEQATEPALRDPSKS